MRRCKNGHDVSPAEDLPHYGCITCVRIANQRASEKYNASSKGIIRRVRGELAEAYRELEAP